MQRKKLCALVLTSLAGTASADVVVEVFSGGAWINAETNPSPTPYASVDGSGNVTISSAPSNAVFRVYTDTPSSESIGTVTVNASSVSTVLIGDEATGLDIDISLADACVNWGGLDGTFSDNVTLQAAVSGDITGDIAADRIFRLDVGNDVLGDSTVDGAFSTSFNNIGLVLAGGDILGDVEATSGTIGTVFAAGDIGSTSTTVTIKAGADVSAQTTEANRETIDIIAADNIYADIVASVTSADEGRFRRIIANTLAQSDGFTSGAGVEGVIAGSITTYDAEIRGTGSPATAIPCINAGEVSADILFFNEPMTPISIDTLTSTGSIRIGDDLSAVTDPANSGGGDQTSMIFFMDAAGLEGQIIINQADGSGDWEANGEIGLGNVPWSPTNRLKPSGAGSYIAPFYEALPSVLGGGSVGLVPFNFHNKAGLLVDPGVSSVQFEAGDTITLSNTNDKEIVIEHYGPVFATGTPLEIHKHVSGAIGTESSWEISGVDNDVTSSWDQAVSSTEDMSERTVTLSPVSDTWVTGWYRARPTATTGGLECAFVEDNPPAVYDSGHGSAALDDYFYFRVLVLFGFDLNQNTVVDAPDAAMWINNPVDFDGDEDADTVDFQLLINNMD